MKRKLYTTIMITIFLLSVFGLANTKVQAQDSVYELEFWYSPSHYGSDENLVADIVAEQLTETGFFDVEIQSAEWSTYVGQLPTMGAFLLGWWFDYPDPSNYIDPFVGSGAFSLGTNYSSSTMDGYIDTMLTNPDASARSAATVDAQNLMAEDVPLIPLFSMIKQFSGYQSDITGYNLEPSENVHYDTIERTGGSNDIVIGVTDSISSLDPADAYDYFSSNTLLQLSHGIMEMPRDSTDAVPGPFVESYSVNANADSYTFNLTDGLVFSDGTDFNATALKWNLDRSRDPNLNGDPSFLLGGIDTIEVVNNTAITINLSSPDATFLQRLTYTNAWPYSPASLPRNEFDGQPGGQIPAGLGPYVVSSWSADTELILEPNPNYQLGTAPSNTITIQFYSDASSLLTALETGSIDVAQKQFGPDEITAIQDSTSLEWVEKETAGIRYIILNVQEHTDKLVRQAMSYAVDRAEITARVFNDLNEPIYSMVPPIFSDSVDAFPQHNDTMAQELMTEAGYTGGGVDEGGEGFLSFPIFSIIFALTVAQVIRIGRKR